MKTKFVVLACFFISSLFCFSQEKKMNPDEYNKLIVLSNNKKSKKVKFIKDNRRIVYKLKGENTKYKGKLTILNDTIISINGKEILLKDLSMIAGRSMGLKATKIIGTTVIASGVTLSTLGIIIYFQSQNKEGCENAFGQIIGTVFFTGGIIVTAIGSIPLAIKPKHFDLEKKWNAKIVFEK